MSVISGKRYK